MLNLICADVGPSGAKPSDPFGDRSSTGLSAFGEPDTGEKLVTDHPARACDFDHAHSRSSACQTYVLNLSKFKNCLLQRTASSKGGKVK